MVMGRHRRVMFTAITVLVALGLIEGASAVVIALASPRLDEPILRTSAIYREQSRQIRSLFFSDTARGLVFDPELGWRYRPGWHDQMTSNNSAGLRGAREYTRVPAPGRLRVAAFGDSFVYGNETHWTDSWPALLEHADSTLEVLNYGVGGYGLDQAFLRYLREGRSLTPSIVLICFTTDDLRRLVNVYRRFISVGELPLFKPRFDLTTAGQLRHVPSPVRSMEDYRQLLDDPPRVRNAGTSDQWYEPLVYHNPAYDLSATVRLGVSIWIRVANRHLRHDRIFVDGEFNRHSAAFRLQLAVFQAFRDSVLAAGDQPLIVFLPDRESVSRRVQGGRAVYFPLTAELTARGIPFLDVSDGFANHQPEGSVGRWFMPGGHYSREGNLVVAEWIAPLLRRAGGDQ